MTDIFVGVFTALGGLGKALGIGGVFWAVASMVLLGFALKFFERACKLIDWCQKKWGGLSTPGKQVVAVLVALLIWKAVWPTLPKTAVALALGAGLTTAFWLGGLSHAHRYDLTDTTPWAAFAHHWNVTQAARGLTKAVGNATGKANGRARKPTITATDISSPIEPPDGMSAQEFADLANNGGLHPSIARQIGWDQTKRMTADPQPDGTVLLTIAKTPADADPLADERWWKL